MTDYPNDEDGAVLSDLASQGVDMTQPLTIDFPVAVPDEEAAKKTADGMTQAGYRPEIEFDEGEPDFNPETDDAAEFGPAWTVFATINMIPAYDEIMRIQSELDAIAKPFGGKSDGWGVMLDDGQE